MLSLALCDGEGKVLRVDSWHPKGGTRSIGKSTSGLVSAVEVLQRFSIMNAPGPLGCRRSLRSILTCAEEGEARAPTQTPRLP